MTLLERMTVLICTWILLGSGGRGQETEQAGASQELTPRGGTVVVAVPGGVDNFNPVVAAELTAGEISELLFASLVDSDFDTEQGRLLYRPLLARSWEYSEDRKDITFHLRNDARWSDGVRVTSDDVKFSYELYGDPVVASVRQSALDQFFRRKDGAPDVERSIEVIDDSTVIFHFRKAYPGQLFDAGLPIVPRHVFADADRGALRSHPGSVRPTSSGPYELDLWEPNQQIRLARSDRSVLPHPAYLDRLVFRVIPDYTSRLTQLKTGEVDVVVGIQPEDVEDLTEDYPSLRMETIPSRAYEFAGWNNVDPEAYRATQGKSVRPHRLFGSKRVRRALTHAINREEIIDGYLGRYGRPAIGSISPLFRWAYNKDLQPLPYDPGLAKRILADEGWSDSDGDGWLDKDGEKFGFTLSITAGDPRRSFAAVVIQNQLKAVGIDVAIEQVEPPVFWRSIMQKQFDAWIAAFSVALQLDLEELWGSDLAKNPFNTVSFQNDRADEILQAAKAVKKEVDASSLWKEFQSILHDEQPCTFLYWMDTIVGVNERVQGTEIGILGSTHHAWNWYVALE